MTKRIVCFLGLVSGFVLATNSLVAAPQKANKLPEPAVSGVTGLMRHPLEEARKAKKKAVVFFFVMTDCPIANRFAPEISRICDEYAKRNIAFYIVQTDPKLTASRAREHANEYNFSCPVLLDRKRELVKFCGASVTPESAMLSPEGKVLYRGRIDDRYVALGQFRLQPKQRDLRLALDAVLNGNPIKTPRTKAIGCYIEG